MKIVLFMTSVVETQLVLGVSPKVKPKASSVMISALVLLLDGYFTSSRVSGTGVLHLRNSRRSYYI